MSTRAIELRTQSPEQTVDLGRRLGALLQPGDVVALTGTLGAGKTCLAKGLALGAGVEDARRVTSPTFVLMRCYQGRLPVYHFNAYRLDDAAQMDEIGCQEVFNSGGVSLIEWADHVAGCLPASHFCVAIRVEGATDRGLTLRAAGDGPGSRLAGIERAVTPWRLAP